MERKPVRPLEFTNEWTLEPESEFKLLIIRQKNTCTGLPVFSKITLGENARLDILFMQNEHSRYWLDLIAALDKGCPGLNTAES